MKKILLSVFMLFALMGCSCNKDVQVTIKKGNDPTTQERSSYLYDTYGLSAYGLESTDEYDEKIENSDTFMLYVYSEGCYGCQQLSPALANYIEENDGSVIYALEKGNIGSKHTLYKDEDITATPYLILIEDGEIAFKELMPTTNDNKAKAKEWLYNWMEVHVKWEG